MRVARSSWRGHLIAAGVLIVLAAAVGMSGRRVDYDWNWQRVPQYLISTEGEAIAAPFDGFAALSPDGKTITLTALKGSDTATIAHYSEALVGDGDLVFQGDPIARTARIGAGPLLKGLWLTLEISFVSLLFSTVLGFAAGLARVARSVAVRDLAAVYVETIRGTPLLVQIFIVYFFIGTVLKLSAFAAGVVALSIFTGAYVAEIVRAGIQAVPRGQTEAAQSLGLSATQTLRFVILPQATKKILPPLAGQFINLIKDSSLVSVMALTDLTKAGREVVGSTFSPFEVWFTVALMYLLLTGGLSWAVQRLERRMARHD
jgi:polar amino acid transport system permease protein